MCGIAGSLGVKNLNKNVFTSSLLMMKHRGPDGYGVLKIDELGAILGHVRLSIIDVSDSASQPMLDASERYILTYNGEIYNYQDIRKELTQMGVSFKTSSDSEVIIEAYKCWKEKMLEKFEGMFAFCILDKNTGITFMARDRFGVKPFYFCNNNKEFHFASELKVIKNLAEINKINERAQYNYFKLGNVLANETIYEEIEPLPAGSYAVFNCKTSDLEIHQYWNPDSSFKKERISLNKEELIENVKEYLKKSFKLRMVADVPVGIFLSGGIDSTLLAAILKKDLDFDFSTFTIGFDDSQYDESGVAKATSKYLGVKNISHNCSFEDFKKEFSKMYNYFDEPFADSSTPLTMLVSSIAREHVKVSLSADGGDEFFGGYTKYYSNNNLYNCLLKVPGVFGRTASQLIKSYIKIKSNKMEINRLGVMEMASNLLSGESEKLKKVSKIEGSIFSDAELMTYLPNVSRFNRSRNNFVNETNAEGIEMLMLHDIHNYMSHDILKKVDMSSMAKSLEGREPFLDHNLFEFLGSIDIKSKFYGNKNKPILRDLLYTYVPKSIIDLPKKGFGAPLHKWSGLLIEDYKEFIYDSFVSKRWSTNYLDTLFTKSKNSVEEATKLWTLLNYLVWEEKYI